MQLKCLRLVVRVGLINQTYQIIFVHCVVITVMLIIILYCNNVKRTTTGLSKRYAAGAVHGNSAAAAASFYRVNGQATDGILYVVGTTSLLLYTCNEYTRGRRYNIRRVVSNSK